MQTFTLGWPRRWPFHGLGRNDLLRRSDRVESLSVIFFGILAIIAKPQAASGAASVHDAEVADQAERAASIHQATATVVRQPKALEDYAFQTYWSVPVQWDVAGASREGATISDVKSEVGDQLPLWVDRDGTLTRAPVTAESASADAVGVALLVWTAVIGMCGGVLQLIRWRLDAIRFDQWEREFRLLTDDGSGRTPR
jgi:hypothetical protein